MSDSSDLPSIPARPRPPVASDIPNIPKRPESRPSASPTLSDLSSTSSNAIPVIPVRPPSSSRSASDDATPPVTASPVPSIPKRPAKASSRPPADEVESTSTITEPTEDAVGDAVAPASTTEPSALPQIPSRPSKQAQPEDDSNILRDSGAELEAPVVPSRPSLHTSQPPNVPDRPSAPLTTSSETQFSTTSDAVEQPPVPNRPIATSTPDLPAIPSRPRPTSSSDASQSTERAVPAIPSSRPQSTSKRPSESAETIISDDISASSTASVSGELSDVKENLTGTSPVEVQPAEAEEPVSSNSSSDFTEANASFIKEPLSESEQTLQPVTEQPSTSPVEALKNITPASEVDNIRNPKSSDDVDAPDKDDSQKIPDSAVENTVVPVSEDTEVAGETTPSVIAEENQTAIETKVAEREILSTDGKDSISEKEIQDKETVLPVETEPSPHASPVIPARPSKSPEKSDSPLLAADSTKEISETAEKSTESITTESIPKAPPRPSQRPQRSEQAVKAPAPPASKPKPIVPARPTSKIASSFIAATSEQVSSKPKPKPPVGSKIGSLRASLFNDLNNMMARGPPPPGGFPMKPVSSEEQEDDDKKPQQEDATEKAPAPTSTNDARKSRAKGPRGRRLPTSAKSEFTIIVDHVWELEPKAKSEAKTDDIELQKTTDGIEDNSSKSNVEGSESINVDAEPVVEALPESNSKVEVEHEQKRGPESELEHELVLESHVEPEAALETKSQAEPEFDFEVKPLAEPVSTRPVELQQEVHEVPKQIEQQSEPEVTRKLDLEPEPEQAQESSTVTSHSGIGTEASVEDVKSESINIAGQESVKDIHALLETEHNQDLKQTVVEPESIIHTEADDQHSNQEKLEEVEGEDE
ncbi:hypothetical protein AWJ20_4581 [Sugiyamaella lignohabitans]|uniref:Uncharacterized protein n=1 Tax=Sugiyamaella lignohabitans TaxID=796027 RepID=A0A167CIV7_9ASCO|nr:uncharacterized protein AWJ20_4581 [Sugiyamaella lignohabitans]ANB11759.1 hypothetical protein AWJ20_4581 [Sugiyamaella lignohabitans]